MLSTCSSSAVRNNHSRLLLTTSSPQCWHCWLGDGKGIRPVKRWVLVCWWWWFCTSYFALQLPPPPLSSLAPTKSRVETFWYRPCGKFPLKRRERESFLPLQWFDAVGWARQEGHQARKMSCFSSSQMFLEALFVGPRLASNLQKNRPRARILLLLSAVVNAVCFPVIFQRDWPGPQSSPEENLGTAAMIPDALGYTCFEAVKVRVGLLR